MDRDQAQCFVRPDLGPNWLQRISAEDTKRQRVKKTSEIVGSHGKTCLWGLQPGPKLIKKIHAQLNCQEYKMNPANKS